MSDLRELYQEVILDHSRKPRNFRRPADANRQARGDNPLCGDKVTVFLTLEDGRVKDVGFEGRGCAISMALRRSAWANLAPAASLWPLARSSLASRSAMTLGASGAVELIACVHAVKDGVAAPTINLDNPDEGFDLDFVPHEARERKIRYAMKNTFGFGGHNVTLVVGRYDR